MASDDGTIKLKGDNSQLDSSTAKSAAGFKQLGEHASRAVGHAKTFGERWEHANSHLTGTIARSVSLAAALEAVVDRMREIQEESKKASKVVGGSALSRDQAARQLGLSNEQVDRHLSDDSAVSKEDQIKFLSSLAGAKFGRGRQKLNEGQVGQLMDAYKSGLYGEHELSEMVSTGDISGIDEAGRSRQLSPEANRELYTRRAENLYRGRADEIRAPGGFDRRENAAALDAYYAGNGQSLTGAASSLPFIGNGVKAAAEEVGVGGVAAADIGVKAAVTSPVSAGISIMTRVLGSLLRPTTAQPAGGD